MEKTCRVAAGHTGRALGLHGLKGGISELKNCTGPIQLSEHSSWGKPSRAHQQPLLPCLSQGSRQRGGCQSHHLGDSDQYPGGE